MWPANSFALWKWWSTDQPHKRLVGLWLDWETQKVREEWVGRPVKEWDMWDHRQGYLLDLVVHWGEGWVEEWWTGPEAEKETEEEEEKKHDEDGTKPGEPEEEEERKKPGKKRRAKRGQEPSVGQLVGWCMS